METIIEIVIEHWEKIALAIVSFFAFLFPKKTKLQKLKKKLQKSEQKERNQAKAISKTVRKEEKIKKEIEECQRLQ